MITAQKVYREILAMPVKERERLFAVIADMDLKRTYILMMKYSAI